MASKPLEKLAWDDTEVIDALSDGDADGLPDDAPMALIREMERDMEPMDPQTMRALMRDMEIKMAAMTRQLESFRPARERSAGLVEPRNIHRPLRPERTLMSPRQIASPTRTTTAPGTSPNSVAGMEAQETQTEVEAEKAAQATLRRVADINECRGELTKWNLHKGTGTLSPDMPVAMQEVESMINTMGLGMLLKPSQECFQGLVNTIAAKLPSDITGMSARKAITVGRHIADHSLDEVNNDTPIIRAVLI